GKWRAEMVGSYQRVTQRDVDSLAAYRRHRMTCVAQKKQAWRSPFGEPVANYVEQEWMRHIIAVCSQVRREVARDMIRHLFDPLLETAPAQLAKTPLLDHPRELEPAVIRWKAKHQMRLAAAAADIGARRASIRHKIRQRHFAPDHVERLR